MNNSKESIFLLTFLLLFIVILVVIVKKNRNMEQDVVVYSLGFKEFEEQGDENEHEVSGLLHISQVLKKAKGNGDLTEAQVDFPKNGFNYIIMLIKVLNYNFEKSSAEMMREDKDDSDFWVFISDGAIGSNSVTVEINSHGNINADVEFYGYKENV